MTLRDALLFGIGSLTYLIWHLLMRIPGDDLDYERD